MVFSFGKPRIFTEKKETKEKLLRLANKYNRGREGERDDWF